MFWNGDHITSPPGPRDTEVGAVNRPQISGPAGAWTHSSRPQISGLALDTQQQAPDERFSDPVFVLPGLRWEKG